MAREPAISESDTGHRAATPISLLKIQIELPLIGTDHFARWALTRCESSGRLETRSAAVARYRNLARAILIMTNEPFIGHTLAALAEAAGMSRSSSARCFVDTYGLGPLSFLKAERLRFAAFLLMTTPISVKSVAVQIGYESASYFTRSFRSKFGIAPREVIKLVGADRNRAIVLDDEMPEMLPNSKNLEQTISHTDLKLICNSNLDALWIIDVAIHRIRWSEGISEPFGYGPGQISQDATWRQEHIHPDDRQRVITSLQHACDAGGKLWRDEFRYRRADGSYALVADRAAIQRDPEGITVRIEPVPEICTGR